MAPTEKTTEHNQKTMVTKNTIEFIHTSCLHIKMRRIISVAKKFRPMEPRACLKFSFVCRQDSDWLVVLSDYDKNVSHDLHMKSPQFRSTKLLTSHYRYNKIS